MAGRIAPQYLQSLRVWIIGLGSFLLLAVIAALIVSNQDLEPYLASIGAAKYMDPQAPTLHKGFIAAGSVALGTFALIPLLPLLLANTTIFGPVWGSLFSLIGAFIAAFVQFTLGRLLHAPILRRIRSELLRTLQQRLSQSGPWPIAIMRVLPVAPFIAINIIAGALKFRTVDFLVGNALGLLFPILATAGLAFEIDRIVQTRHLRLFLLIMIVFTIGAFLMLAFTRRIFKRNAQES